MRRPFNEGDLIDVTPTRLGKRGDAEAEHEGWRVTVQGGIPGENARVRVLHVSRGGPVARARFIETATPHPARRAAPCPIHDRCGGCGLQHFGEEAALEAKIAPARELLPADWKDPIRSPLPFGYRNKTFLLVQRQGDRFVFGARPPRGEKLVDTTGCNVLRPALENIAGQARARIFSERVRTILLRCNRAGQAIATVVHTGAPVEVSLDAAAVYTQRHDAPGNRICSDEEEVLVSGDRDIAERFGEIDVRIPPTAFWQGNADVAEALYKAAAAELHGQRLVELYCGAGAAGLMAVQRTGAQLTGIDKSPRAVAAARATADRNGLPGRFEVGAAEQVDVEADSVLVNPPRAGCHADVIAAIARSKAQRLVYLSCNPVTLARDTQALGWKLEWVQPADMLPQTPHLELLALFTRP